MVLIGKAPKNNSLASKSSAAQQQQSSTVKVTSMTTKPIKIANSSAVTLVGSKRGRRQSNLNEAEMMADLNTPHESLIVVPNQSEPIKIQSSVNKEQSAKEQIDQKKSNEVLSEESQDLTAKESLDLTSKRSKNMTHISVRRHVEAIHDS